MVQGSTGQHASVSVLVHHYAAADQDVLDPHRELLGLVASCGAIEDEPIADWKIQRGVPLA